MDEKPDQEENMHSSPIPDEHSYTNSPTSSTTLSADEIMLPSPIPGEYSNANSPTSSTTLSADEIMPPSPIPYDPSCTNSPAFSDTLSTNLIMDMGMSSSSSEEVLADVNLNSASIAATDADVHQMEHEQSSASERLDDIGSLSATRNAKKKGSGNASSRNSSSENPSAEQENFTTQLQPLVDANDTLETAGNPIPPDHSPPASHVDHSYAVCSEEVQESTAEMA